MPLNADDERKRVVLQGLNNSELVTCTYLNVHT